MAVTITENIDSCHVRLRRASIVAAPVVMNRSNSCGSRAKLLTMRMDDRNLVGAPDQLGFHLLHVFGAIEHPLRVVAEAT